MKFFKANWDTIIIRYNLMILIVVASFTAGYPMMSLLSILVFLSAILGVKFERTDLKESKILKNKFSKEKENLKAA